MKGTACFGLNGCEPLPALSRVRAPSPRPVQEGFCEAAPEPRAALPGGPPRPGSPRKHRCWTPGAARDGVCFFTTMQPPVLHEATGHPFEGVIQTRNASLEAIWCIHPPAPGHGLFVSVYPKFLLLLTSQDTQFWAIKLEKEGKDAYQLDLLWIPCVGSNWLLRNSKEQVPKTFFSPRNVSIMVFCNWLLPSLNHALSKRNTNHSWDGKRKSAKQTSCPELLDFWTSVLPTLRN